MNEEFKKALLAKKEVVEEINRHLWLESEKAGYDIGFAQASEDWLGKYADAWIKYHLPNGKKSKAIRTKRTTVAKTRRASSYFK